MQNYNQNPKQTETETQVFLSRLKLLQYLCNCEIDINFKNKSVIPNFLMKITANNAQCILRCVDTDDGRRYSGQTMVYTITGADIYSFHNRNIDGATAALYAAFATSEISIN